MLGREPVLDADAASAGRVGERAEESGIAARRPGDEGAAVEVDETRSPVAALRASRTGTPAMVEFEYSTCSGSGAAMSIASKPTRTTSTGPSKSRPLLRSIP